MGSHVAQDLETSLLKAGFPSDTPICIIKEISAPSEQMLCLTLDRLTESVLALGKGAMIIYVNLQPLKSDRQQQSLKSQFQLELDEERRMII